MMEEILESYAARVGFATRPIIRRKGKDSYIVAQDIVHLDIAALETCPSIDALVVSIERRVSRSPGMKDKHKIVPLCICLLCSDLYTINSSTLDGIVDSTVERCWECLEHVSHTVDRELQAWLGICMKDRGCREFSHLFCQPASRERALQLLPSHAVPRGATFAGAGVPQDILESPIWHRDDVVSMTMIVHLRMAYQSTCRITDSDDTNRDDL